MDAQGSLSRVERAARNQALFREVNERLQELASDFQATAGSTVFSCECADLSCVAQIDMTLDEYEAVRSDPNQFLVLAAHVIPDVENIVRADDGYVVVAKIGEGGEIAAEADPRA
jgi:hypothetical protein